MKWIVLVLFAATFCSSLLWFNAAERRLTGPQQTAVGFVAIEGWIITFALAAVT